MRGTVSATSDAVELKVVPGGGGYATRTMRLGEGESAQQQNSTTNWSLEDIQIITGLVFDTLVIDCEGCIIYLLPLESGSRLARSLRHVHTIVLEGDMPLGAPDCESACVDYAQVIKALSEAGFSLGTVTPEPLYPHILYYVFTKSAAPTRRAQLRGGL